MADQTVWIDLGEVEAAAKKILGLLGELKGPANKLSAAVKQVQESVYGTDLLGKALQGSGSSVGGLAQHQEQVLEGIRTLLQNATAVGENLQSMVARHRTNDDEHATSIGRIADTGTMPVGPQLAGLTTGGTAQATPAYAVHGRLLGTEPMEELRPRMMEGRRLEPQPMVQATPQHIGHRPIEDPSVLAPPPAVEPLGNTDPGVEYHDPDAPTLDYNPPNPFVGPDGVWIGPMV
ncbi:WXG100 family type VII secretion target [Kitasatospora sp. NBC_01539]|uniref:WXG100 family type VII secretion target n=1 Tax=Kitasatospora sp. NBC_01539 TaxID=2903577 RepID=UPI0038601BE2